jgi:hypothetical protein
VVFGGLAPSGQVNNDRPLTERTGWQFDVDAGWRQIAMAPEAFVYSRRSFVSQQYLYVFSGAPEAPSDAAIFDPAADRWITTPPPVSLPLPPTVASCTTASGWFSGYGPVVHFDESSLQWSESEARGVGAAACTGEGVFGRSSVGNVRFSFEQNDWVAAAPDGLGGALLYSAGAHIAAAPTDSNPDVGWKTYDPKVDEWTEVPRTCEPSWPLHYTVATDYGLVVWKQATDEDPYGEGRLLVLPDSKPLP